MIIGKLKGKLGKFVKLSSDAGEKRELSGFLSLSGVSVAAAKKFDPNYRPEENEWVYISLANDLDLIAPFKSSAVATVALNPAQTAEIKSLQLFYIPVTRDGALHRLYFQQITPSAVVHDARFWSFSEEASIKVRSEKNLVHIHNRVDALWDEESKTLYFHKFEKARSMFPGLEKFFREATDQEVAEFASAEIFSRNGALDVKTRNRKRIAFVLQEKKELLKKRNLPKLKQYISKYALGVRFENDKILLSDETIETVIKTLCEHYYTAEVSGEKREANSIRKLDGNHP